MIKTFLKYLSRLLEDGKPDKTEFSARVRYAMTEKLMKEIQINKNSSK